MQNWFDKNKFFEKLLIFTWIIFLVFCMFLLSFTSKAASSSNYSLPYYVDYYKSSYFTSSFDYWLNVSVSPDMRFFGEPYNDNGSVKCKMYMFDFSNNYHLFNHSLNAYLNYDQFDFTYDYIVLYNVPYIVLSFRDGYFRQDSYNTSDGSVESIAILGRQPFNYNSYGYTANVPFGCKTGSILYYYSNGNPVANQYVICNGSPSPVSPTLPTGHATPPNNNNDPVYTIGHNRPDAVPPNITINNYTWTTSTPPSIDNSDISSLIESFISIFNYLIGWLSENLSGEFANFLTNLQVFINYIGANIQYYGDLILSSFNDLQDFLYDNFVSLFENIDQNISYITEPLDQNVIYDNISTTSLVTNITIIQTSLSSFQASFTGVSEPSSFTIPIHLENLPSNWFGNQTTQYIDLGVINGTVKDGLRLFVWAMVTYSLVVTIFDSIANYINGGGDES